MKLIDYICKWLVIFSLPLLWTAWLWIGLWVLNRYGWDCMDVVYHWGLQ